MHAGQFLKNLSLPDSFGRFWGQFLQGLPDSFGIFWDNFYRACQTVLEYFGTIFTGPARQFWNILGQFLQGLPDERIVFEMFQ
jgi:hypothetical protein